jgi:hypothetical protein
MGLKLNNPCYEIVYPSDDPEEEEFHLICRHCWEENDTLPMPTRTYCFSSVPQEFRNQRCDFCYGRFWRYKKHITKFTLGDIQQIREEIAKVKIRRKENCKI